MEFKIQPINTKITVYLNNGEQVTVDKNLLDALPDMFEACEKSLEAIDAALNRITKEDWPQDMIDAYELLCPAIAKAKGK